ncbi:hypothetical protein [Epilithonimonas sp.]|uniref:hypothetical protein n=1 Tax=Epilithonimonas sp. TaxID=2894511 RepID=UPI0035B4A559
MPLANLQFISEHLRKHFFDFLFSTAFCDALNLFFCDCVLCHCNLYFMLFSFQKFYFFSFADKF